MGKSNLLTSIGLDIETFKAHLKRISKEDYKVHQLDKDLLLEKTRQLYDNILQIEVDGKPQEEVKKPIEKVREPEKKIIQEHKAEKIEEKPEPIVEKPVAREEIVVEKPKIEDKVATEKIKPLEEEQKPEIKEAEKKQEVNIDFKQSEKYQPKEVEPQTIPLDTATQPEYNTKPESAYDLFSPSTNTVSDKFVSDEDKSVASRLKQNKLNDLRDAIGINEKFLFINELFNGDMGRYNKAIDEINSMQNKIGTDTYIMELKIEKQWDVESDAFIKFKDLIDRKFN